MTCCEGNSEPAFAAPIQRREIMAPRVHPHPKIGARYGRWTVVGGAHPGDRIPCLCDCGVRSLVRFPNLYNGISKSCGCRSRDTTRARNHKHGDVGTKLYRTWKNMLGRCRYPLSTGYRDYGGRGIRVCDAWSEYAAFRSWALANGYDESLEIDRIDVNGNYEPANCRFVTHTTNARNTRRNRYITAFGETKTVADWEDDPRCVVGHSCLINRLNRAWPHERALTTPSAVQA